MSFPLEHLPDPFWGLFSLQPFLVHLTLSHYIAWQRLELATVITW